MKRRRARILYATMSSNTEKIARAFAETFEEYNWDVYCLRIRSQKELAEQQEFLFFDDYDVICLGSSIVGGMPLQPGRWGKLESNAEREIMKAKAFAADFIEDFFMTYDGEQNPPLSNIISIS